MFVETMKYSSRSDYNNRRLKDMQPLEPVESVVPTAPQPADAIVNIQKVKQVDIAWITVDADLKRAIPPLMPAEYNLLKQSISTEGLREPLTMWGKLIIDGHNRLEICTELKYSRVPVVWRKFKDKSEAILWIITNQLSRRNLTDERRAYYIGMLVKSEKKPHGDTTRLTVQKVKNRVFEQSDPSGQNDHMEKTDASGQNDHKKKSRSIDIVARQLQVSPKTAQRAEKFAVAVDRVKEAYVDAADKILSGNARKVATKGAIEQLADASDEDIKKAAKAIVEDKPEDMPKPPAKPATFMYSNMPDTPPTREPVRIGNLLPEALKPASAITAENNKKTMPDDGDNPVSSINQHEPGEDTPAGAEPSHTASLLAVLDRLTDCYREAIECVSSVISRPNLPLSELAEIMDKLSSMSELRMMWGKTFTAATTRYRELASNTNNENNKTKEKRGNK